jgi:serine/threonine protein kinase
LDKKERKSQKEIVAEISIGLTLGQECPFLVLYLEMFYYKNFCCLIMEYCELGDLQQELDSGKWYEEPVSYSYFVFILTFLGVKKRLIYIARGLLKLHSAKMIHRDFKPGNVFINNIIISFFLINRWLWN